MGVAGEGAHPTLGTQATTTHAKTTKTISMITSHGNAFPGGKRSLASVGSVGSVFWCTTFLATLWTLVVLSAPKCLIPSKPCNSNWTCSRASLSVAIRLKLTENTSRSCTQAPRAANADALARLRALRFVASTPSALLNIASALEIDNMSVFAVLVALAQSRSASDTSCLATSMDRFKLSARFASTRSSARISSFASCADCSRPLRSSKAFAADHSTCMLLGTSNVARETLSTAFETTVACSWTLSVKAATSLPAFAASATRNCLL
mmetsp:Transcript_8114/g.20272  ORF Transcript_8114/g.20272 Transcript_8114/m.20272 type:complete len:266 (-) Transcript_8114:1055-1852(-)